MEVIMIALSDNLYFYKLLAPTTGLCHYGIVFLCHQQGFGGYRNTIED